MPPNPAEFAQVSQVALGRAGDTKAADDFLAEISTHGMTSRRACCLLA